MYRLCNTEHNMHYAACCSVCSSPSSNPAPTSRCPQETGTKVDHRRRLVLWHKGSRRDKTSKGEPAQWYTCIHTQYGTHSHGHVCACTHTYMCTQYTHSHTRVRHCCYCLLLLYYGYLCLLFQVQWGSKGTTEEGAKLKRAKVSDIIPWFTVY